MEDDLTRRRREWIARRRARIDQMQKQFEDQYPFVPARINLRRIEDLEAWKFEIEINEWELENCDEAQD